MTSKQALTLCVAGFLAKLSLIGNNQILILKRSDWGAFCFHEKKTYREGRPKGHAWPGNVRELRNIAELYAVGIIKLTGKEKLYTQAETQLPLDELVDDFEKGVIEDALFLHSGRVSEAADYLQVPRKKLYLRMKKHAIDKDKFKSRS